MFMNTTDLRTKYLETRKTSGMDAAKFDAQCLWTLRAEGLTGKPTPAQWVDAAAEVAHFAAHPMGRGCGATADGKCGRCGGVGIVQAFITVNGGECFECGGSGAAEVA